MCWKCDIEQAEALLADAKRVFDEARVLQQRGGRMQAQAYGELDRASRKGEANEPVCTEGEEL